MATDIIKKFWDKLSRRHDNLGKDDSFYALFSNGFSKAKIKLDHITRVVVREYDEETLKKILKKTYMLKMTFNLNMVFIQSNLCPGEQEENYFFPPVLIQCPHR